MIFFFVPRVELSVRSLGRYLTLFFFAPEEKKKVGDTAAIFISNRGHTTTYYYFLHIEISTFVVFLLCEMRSCLDWLMALMCFFFKNLVQRIKL